MERTVIPLATALGRLQGEIGRAAAQLNGVETALVSLLSSAGVVKDELVSDLQQLDAVLQALLALRLYCGNLAALSDDRWRIDAISAVSHISLTELASRLSGVEAAPAAAGEFELL